MESLKAEVVEAPAVGFLSGLVVALPHCGTWSSPHALTHGLLEPWEANWPSAL